MEYKRRIKRESRKIRRLESVLQTLEASLHLAISTGPENPWLSGQSGGGGANKYHSLHTRRRNLESHVGALGMYLKQALSHLQAAKQQATDERNIVGNDRPQGSYYVMREARSSTERYPWETAKRIALTVPRGIHVYFLDSHRGEPGMVLYQRGGATDYVLLICECDSPDLADDFHRHYPKALKLGSEAPHPLQMGMEDIKWLNAYATQNRL